MGGGAALGVANNSQFRANNAGMASFAQTLGGGQQQSSLDPSYVVLPFSSEFDLWRFTGSSSQKLV